MNENNYYIAYEEGYQKIKETLTNMINSYQKKHSENLKKVTRKINLEESFINNQNEIDKAFNEESNLLILSRLKRFFPNIKERDDFKDKDDAYKKGLNDALNAIAQLIYDTSEFAKNDEEKAMVNFLKNFFDNLCEVIQSEFNGLSFLEWKQENHCEWFLASREQDEQYFEEYLDYLKEQDYLFMILTLGIKESIIEKHWNRLLIMERKTKMKMNTEEKEMIVQTIKKATNVINPFNYSNNCELWREMGKVKHFINDLSDMLVRKYEFPTLKEIDIELMKFYGKEIDRMIELIKCNQVNYDPQEES